MPLIPPIWVPCSDCPPQIRITGLTAVATKGHNIGARVRATIWPTPTLSSLAFDRLTLAQVPRSGSAHCLGV